jgi:hypothetical protein
LHPTIWTQKGGKKLVVKNYAQLSINKKLTHADEMMKDCLLLLYVGSVGKLFCNIKQEIENSVIKIL